MSLDFDAVLADPPLVHPGARTGVWGADRSLYEFLRQHVTPDSRTLETGLGISTALFAVWRTAHTCVVGDQAQVDRLRSWATAHDVDVDGVTFCADYSDRVLPQLSEPVDVFLIDGGHGYPTPILDWYYGGRLLVPNGVVIVDDAQLPAIDAFLIAFLDADPRWESIGGANHRWRAYRKADHDLREEWDRQPFLGRPAVAFTTRLKVAVNRLLPRRWRR